MIPHPSRSTHLKGNSREFRTIDPILGNLLCLTDGGDWNAFQGAAANTLRERELHVDGGPRSSDEHIHELADTKQVSIENAFNFRLSSRIWKTVDFMPR
jgi:hypothetical protein